MKIKAKPDKPRPEIILCRDDGRVACFISVKNYHLNTCGVPGRDWRYLSPKSICLGTESGRGGPSAGHLISMAKCLATMTGFKLRDELLSCDTRTSGKDMRNS